MSFGIVNQALFIGANLRLQFRNSLLQKVPGRAGELSLLFHVGKDERIGDRVCHLRGLPLDSRG